MPRVRIGSLAARTGTSAPTIRYYEEIGLLRPADRQPSGQRIYGEEDIKRLTFHPPLPRLRILDRTGALAGRPGAGPR